MSSEAAESPTVRKTVRKTYGRALNPDRLSYELAVRNWTKRDLAEQAGIAASTVTVACSGLPVTRDVREKIAKALASKKPDPGMVAIVAKPEQVPA